MTFTPKLIEITVTKEGDKIIMIDTIGKFKEIVTAFGNDPAGVHEWAIGGGAKYVASTPEIHSIIDAMSKFLGVRAPPIVKEVKESEI